MRIKSISCAPTVVRYKTFFIDTNMQPKWMWLLRNMHVIYYKNKQNSIEPDSKSRLKLVWSKHLNGVWYTDSGDGHHPLSNSYLLHLYLYSSNKQQTTSSFQNLPQFVYSPFDNIIFAKLSNKTSYFAIVCKWYLILRQGESITNY